MTNTRGRKVAGKAAPTGGDKGSKKSNDFERLGESARRPRREPTTEAGIVSDNVTKNHSQVTAVPGAEADPKRKLRKTSKGEKGSRKPGTELTKAERGSF